MKQSLSASLSALALCGAVLAPGSSAEAVVRLPHLISDGMVLQRRTPVRLWGEANPGERVSVTLNQRVMVTTAKPDGSFEVQLKPMEAGGPYTLIFQGGDSSAVIVKDVLVGEVWVCSGQSNMEWNMGWLGNTKEEIASARDAQLRMFTVPKGVSATPLTSLTGGAWKPTAPENTATFSAVAYYFGKHLRKSLNVPVGLIHTSWGGTRIEAWTSREVLLKQGTPESEFATGQRDSPEYRAAKARYERNLTAWKAAGSPQGAFDDPGRNARTADWANVTITDEAGWKPVRVPGEWERAGVEELEALDGAVWFRYAVTIPEAMAGKSATLTLGAIDDRDVTFVNGVKVGETGAETPNSWTAPRKYTVPAGVLKSGHNVIAVRVWDGQGGGGFTGPTGDMKLTGADGASVPLAGEWRYRVEIGRPQDPGGGPDATNPNAAAGLYNAMLAPIVKYTIRGATWYQGESNAGNPKKYRQQLPDMITNWRQAWGIGDFPFLVVQLASFMAPATAPGVDSGWAGLREAQTMATTRIPNVGVAVITDLGDEKDIHPQRKEPVGDRLGLLARKIAYGDKKVVANGPRYKNFTVKGNTATVKFETATPLVAQGTDSRGQAVPAGRVVGFSVKDDTGKWHWADAKVTGKDTVEVTAPQGVRIVAVRYGWADFPVVNLWNATLPADSFRTDPD